MSLDFKSVYKKQIIEIEKQILAAAKDKKWVELAKLESKKVDLQNNIKQIEELSHGR